jgi:hypothetical protein
MTQEKCVECGQIYYVRIVGMGVPGCKEKEDEVCPICGTVNRTHVINGYVLTERHDQPQRKR